MFVVSLLTIAMTKAKTKKQPKYPSTDERIKCGIYIYIYIIIFMAYYSAIKNNEILPFATMWMDLESI